MGGTHRAAKRRADVERRGAEINCFETKRILKEANGGNWYNGKCT